MKKEVKDGWGRIKIASFFIVFSILSLLLIGASSAKDVAYIYEKNSRVDQNILGVFDELGMSYELIQENEMPQDFSDYKLIFVGDERFSNPENIPVDKVPTVIANYYHGGEFGITDYDGVSKLASNVPLSVKKGNQVLQVYTEARYSIGGISIPYYFLDDHNKAPQMQAAARTYTGNEGDHYDFGDVISYANPGTKLENNKITEAKVCFYGIVESDYWTPAARQLFKDCVGFVIIACSKDSDCGTDEEGDKYCRGKDVYQDITSYTCQSPGTEDSKCVKDEDSNFIKRCPDVCEDGECKEIRCYNDSDCDDNNNYTQDTCINPGKTNSYCDHNPILCLKDSDCGTNYYGDLYCKEGNVYQDYTEFSCLGYKCSNITSSKLIENCTDICEDGSCITRECTKESDCGTDYYGDKYCMNNDSYHDFHDFSCTNWECNEQITPKLLDKCENGEICIGGMCKTIICNKDADCGENGFTGDKYCINKDLYEDFISYTCNNPGQTNSYCSNNTTPILKEHCENQCANGQCIAECNIDNDCGTDYYGDKYCQTGDVWNDFHDFSCTSGKCVENITKTFNVDCGEVSYSEWEYSCRGKDVWRTRTKYDRGCANGACFLASTSEEEKVKTCDYSCTNGACLNECSQNSDCNDGIFCNGEEKCRNGACVSGTNIDCSAFNKIGIASCNNNPDGNPLTYDYRKGFTSQCNEETDSCTTQDVQITHTCNISCGAECSSNADCECEENYCNGTTLVKYSGNSICGTTCLCQECSKEYVQDSPLCGYIEPKCGDGKLDAGEECDDGNNINGDGCSADCKIEEIACYEDSECGTNHWLEEEYCVCTKDLWDYYVKVKCVNPGKTNSYCEATAEPKLRQDCGESSCGEWQSYCKGTEVWKKRECYDRGCNNSQCYENKRIEEIKDKDCIYECSNGECKDECNQDSDCNDDYFGKKYCENDDVFVDLNDYSCIDHKCIKNIIKNKTEECGQDECNGEIKYCKGKQAWKNQTCYDKGCTNGACFSNSFVNSTFIEECVYDCVNGECIGECSKDNECGTDFYGENYCKNDDVYNNFHDFKCLNSACSENISELFHEECGTDSCTEWQNYCIGKDVWQKRTCNDKGCANGACFSNSSEETLKVKTCDYECLDGECADECSRDSDCQADYYGENYCMNNDIWNDFHDFSCTSGKCAENITKVFHVDCGEVSYSEWEYSCRGKDVWKTRTKYDRGCANGACFLASTSEEEKVKTCDYSCTNGECEGECNTDSDCGTDYYGDKYCMNNDSYHDFHDFSCTSGKCEEDVTKKLVKDCGESEIGDWENICEDKNIYKERESTLRGCADGECTSTYLSESDFVETCEHDCIDGECTEIPCSENSDCGTDGWLNNNYCVCTTYLWDFWISYTCENAGTVNSYCTNSTSAKLKQDCGKSHCGEWQNFCKNNNVYRKRTCYEQGCKTDQCVSKEYVEEEMVKLCIYGCENGACKDFECGGCNWTHDPCNFSYGSDFSIMSSC